MKLQEYEREHLACLRGHLAECTVLLKTDGSFPLEAPCRLALYGSGARRTVKGGTGSGEVNSRFFITAEQGLRDAGFEITTNAWLDGYDAVCKKAEADFIRAIKRRARKNHSQAVFESMGAVMPEPEYMLPLLGDGDAAVYVLARTSGEGSDRDVVRGDILLSETEIRDIRLLAKQFAKFMLVLNVGGPVDLSPVLDVGNILVLSQLGVETGAALADILLGRAYPSGKLATTWAAASDAPAVGEFGDINETRYKEGVYVGYRWYDTAGVRPLFPFGFGLGYTSFDISAPEVTLDGVQTTVRAAVKNTGVRPGRQTVQLYVSAPCASLDKPFQTLAAFGKTAELAPGETETLTLRFALPEIASFDSEKCAFVLEKGDYFLRLGVSSRETAVCGVLRLGKSVVVKKVPHAFGTPDFEDWRPETHCAQTPPDGCPILEIDASRVPCEESAARPEPAVDPEISALSDEALTFMNIGAFDPNAGLMNVIGNASRSVAGAAGETTGTQKENGIPVLVMADGPAGLRLSKDYAVDGTGVYAIGSSMPESSLKLLPLGVRIFLKMIGKKPPAGSEVRHQYATAIPIGTALAQSWNTEFARLCGDIVGDEMERLGVHLWLAPALNIHRSIRCGRNFEYFSEDPLVSGLFAAALTEGVQAHTGCGVTVKHFAANNQETNRFKSNSGVSERAMREIYLRGFEICVKRAQPCALMTSYNLLNGVHTSERRDLIEDTLRGEFGFEGIVMTDWIVDGMTNRQSVHPAPDAARIAAAGGDLVMPGGKRDYESILAAIRAGTLSRRQLEINASRVFRMARRLAVRGRR